MTVLSIDGFPMALGTLRQSIEKGVQSMHDIIIKLCRGCAIDDIFEYIDSRTNPHHDATWFRDSPQNTDQGYSIFTDPANKFDRYKDRLLSHFSKDPGLFTITNGKATPLTG